MLISTQVKLYNYTKTIVWGIKKIFYKKQQPIYLKSSIRLLSWSSFFAFIERAFFSERILDQFSAIVPRINRNLVRRDHRACFQRAVSIGTRLFDLIYPRNDTWKREPVSRFTKRIIDLAE